MSSPAARSGRSTRSFNEVEAISDGRSLHRRVAAGEGGDELSRLVSTLNAMIGRLETSFSALRRFTADAKPRTEDTNRSPYFARTSSAR
jgi:hypothetical protein